MGTSAMTQHLQVHHRLKEAVTKKTAPAQDITGFFTPTQILPSAQSSRLGPKPNLARKICLHLNCRLMLPFSISDSDAFFDFLSEVKVVKTKTEMPSRKSVSSTALTEICNEFEDGIKRFFVMCEPLAIGTSFDMWTDSHGRNNYINLSVHFIDKLWNLRCVNLGTDPLERKHTAVRIEAHINEKLEFFSLSHHTNISVKDNGANVVAASRNMAIRTGIRKKDIDDYTCYAHNIHLLLMKDVLKDPRFAWLRDLILKVKKSHRTLVFKMPEMKKRNIAESSLKLQNFYVTMDEVVSEILEIEDDDEDVHANPPPLPTAGVTFKASNDTRWDSTRVLLKTRRENEGE